MRAHAVRAPWRAPAPSRDVLRQQRRQRRQSQHRRRRQRQRGVRRLPACGPPSLYPQGTRGRRRCASEAHPPPLPARRPPRRRWFRLRWFHHRSVLSSRRAVVSAASRTMRSPRRFPRSSPLRARRCRTRYGHLHRSRHRSRRHRRSRRRPRMPTRRMATRRMRPMQAFLLNQAFLNWDASRRRPRMAAAAARAGARHRPPPSAIAGTAAAAAATVVVARAPAGTALAAVAVTAAVLVLAAVASERALGASTAAHYTRRDLKRRMAPCRAARRRTALPPSRPRTSSAPSPAHRTPPHRTPTPHPRPLGWPTRLLPRSRSWRWALCRARRWALCRAWRWALCRARV